MLSDALLRFSQLMLSGLFVVWVGVTLP